MWPLALKPCHLLMGYFGLHSTAVLSVVIAGDNMKFLIPHPWKHHLMGALWGNAPIFKHWNMAPCLTYFLLYCGFLLTPKEISTSTPCVSSTGRSVLVSTLNCFLVPSWKSLRSRTINTQKVHHTQALPWLLYLRHPSMLLGDRWV